MRNDLLDILTHSNKNIDNQQLMAYLSDQLNEEEKRLIEKEMIDSDLLSDAVEGLSAVKNKGDIENYTNDINIKLTTFLSSDKPRKPKHRLKDLPALYIAITLVLVVAIVAFLLVYFQLLG